MSTRSVSRRRPGRDWRHAPPVQERSRLTLDAFAEATEELLRDRPFESISVQDIVRRAGRPIGSFYARFPSKDALLPYLYARYHEGLESLLDAKFARGDWESMEFGPCVAAIVELYLGVYEERRWLLRALALFSRTRPEALPADIVETRRRSYERSVTILMRHRRRIGHPDPEGAIRFGIFMVSTIAREKLLFAQAPLSRITPMSREGLRAELERALRGYLVSGEPSPRGLGVRRRPPLRKKRA